MWVQMSKGQAGLLLRLLIDGCTEDELRGFESQSLDPAVVWKFASENRIRLRLSDALSRTNLQGLGASPIAVKQEKSRVSHLIERMDEISRTCEKAGIQYLFMKNAQHYPDMGEDIDLLIDGDERADRVITCGLGVSKCRLSALNRFSGITQYFLRDISTHLEIHHGRIGRFGEQSALSKVLLDRGRVIPLGEASLFVPSVEGQITIQVLERLYSRLAFRVSELVYTTKVLRAGDVDLEQLESLAQTAGISQGMEVFLQVAERLADGTSEANATVDDTRHGYSEYQLNAVPFRFPFFFLPFFPFGLRLVLAKVQVDFERGDWRSLGRIISGSLVATPILLEKVVRRAWT